MAEALTGAGALILLAVLAGLWRVLRGPTRADRLMAVQLIGTGGIAVLLILAAAQGEAALLDVALLLALVSASGSVALVMAARVLGDR